MLCPALSSSLAPGSLENWSWKTQIERTPLGALSVLILSPSLLQAVGQSGPGINNVTSYLGDPPPPPQTPGPTDMLGHSAYSPAMRKLGSQQKFPTQTTFPSLPLTPLKIWGALKVGFQPL